MIPLFPTAYFPPIPYFSAILQSGYHHILIEAKETYHKQTYRNRMEILTANGIHTLSVPVIKNNHSRTEEVKIDYTERWNVIHWRTLKTAYSASPYFEYYSDALENILMTRHTYLTELNNQTLTWCLQKLNCATTGQPTEEYTPEGTVEEDYRNRFSPKQRNTLEETNRPYYQVFSDRFPFQPNLSILDLLMNLGPEAKDYLLQKN